VILYGRPSAPRNGFFLAVDALRRAREGGTSLGRVVSAGEQFSTRQLQLDDLLQCVGFRPRAELADLYRGFTAGVVPMLSAHPGVVPYELAAAGVNVVVPRAPENVCFFDGASPLLNVEPRPGAIADAIADAVDRPPLPMDERRRVVDYFARAADDVADFVRDVRAGRWLAAHPRS
jgi:glycosyltransferase involved in cell wall biosynthesis